MSFHHPPGAVAVLADEPQRAARFDPNARAFEAFSFRERTTELLDALEATTLDEALAETTSRWSWDRGGRLGVREIGKKVDKLHIYACRRTSTVTAHRACHDNPFGRTPLAYKRRLEHICTIDLNIIAGIDMIGVGSERQAFEHHHRQRPEGARLERRP